MLSQFTFKLHLILIEMKIAPPGISIGPTPLTCEIPFSTFETRSRFLPPYHVVRDRDRDFYLPIMWFEIEIFEIEIFHH